MTDTLTIETLQNTIAARWGTSAYSDAHNARESPLNHADHALKHLMKSLGKVATVLEAFDHRDPLAELAGPLGIAAPTYADVAAYLEAMLADLVIVTGRLAETNPAGWIDLARVVRERVAARFRAPPARYETHTFELRADGSCQVCGGDRRSDDHEKGRL